MEMSAIKLRNFLPLALSGAVVLLLCCSNSDATVKLEKSEYPDEKSMVAFSTYSVLVSPQIYEAVSGHIKDFELRPLSYYPNEIRHAYPFTISQSPSAVFGDFNGDKIEDAVFIGNDSKYAFTLVLLSKSEVTGKVPQAISYSVKEFSKTSLAEVSTLHDATWSYLVLRRKGKIMIPNDSSELEAVELRNDAFEVVIWGKAAVIYYLNEDNAFEKLVSAD